MLQLFILFIIVIIGGAIGFYSDAENRKALKAALTFSASFILGITILHLIPTLYSDYRFSLGLWVLGGFYFQVLIDVLSSGVEHGHIHSHKNAPRSWAIQILLGLSIHALIEGMPLLELAEQTELSHAGHTHHLGGWNYFFSLVLHKMPAAYALVLLLRLSGFKKSFVIGCLIVFALMSPLGAIIIQWIDLSGAQLQALVAFVVGAFLHIATTIIFETDTNGHHKFSWQKMTFSLLGAAVAIIAEMI